MKLIKILKISKKISDWISTPQCSINTTLAKKCQKYPGNREKARCMERKGHEGYVIFSRKQLMSGIFAELEAVIVLSMGCNDDDGWMEHLAEPPTAIPSTSAPEQQNLGPIKLRSGKQCFKQ
jgi:hypothetical protein